MKPHLTPPASLPAGCPHGVKVGFPKRTVCACLQEAQVTQVCESQGLTPSDLWEALLGRNQCGVNMILSPRLQIDLSF